MKRTYSKSGWCSPSFEGLTPSPLDWARLAAFIDGEGSILMNTQQSAKLGLERGRFYLRVTVANTDVRLMVWLKETFGGTFKDANTEKYYEGKNWKRAYHWGASAHRGAWVLRNCLPYFIMKAAQAELGLQLQESLSSVGRPGSKGLDATVIEHRKNLKGQLTLLKAKGRDTA
jgi:hypothetical protein